MVEELFAHVLIFLLVSTSLYSHMMQDQVTGSTHNHHTYILLLHLSQGAAQYCEDAVAGDIIFECDDGDGCPNSDISIWYRITRSPNETDRKQTHAALNTESSSHACTCGGSLSLSNIRLHFQLLP